jgi:type VII secretion protein EccE
MSQPVRGAARVATVARRRPVALTRRRDPSAAGRDLVRLMLVQAALLVAAGTLAGRHWLAGAAAAVGALTVLALLRRRGRWGTEHAGIVWRYRRRRASSAITTTNPLHRLAPDLAIDEVNAGDAGPAGVGSDDSGWFAVVELTPPSGPWAEAWPPMPLARLLRAVTDADQPGVSLQLVTATVGSPLGAETGAASYRALQLSCGGVPVDRLRWLVVHLDLETVALAVADVGMAEADRAVQTVAALAHRLVRAVDRLGQPGRVLDAAGLSAALRRSLDLDGPTTPVRESWRGWRSAELVHVTYWVRDWPALTGRTDALDRIGAVGAARSSVAVRIRPHGDQAELRCLVRVASPAPAIRTVCAALTRAANSAGLRLFRLDGEQAPAAYASAPTGGGPR